MLQLKALHYLTLLTGCKPSECKSIKFGCDVQWITATTYNLASQEVPESVYLLVHRLTHVVVNTDTASTDFGYFRSNVRGKAWWVISNTINTSEIQQFTSENLSANLHLDVDDFILFPPGYYANLLFSTTLAAPSGNWRFRSVAYGFFIPPKVADKLGPSTALTTDDLIT